MTVITADIFEPIAAVVTADTTAYSADNTTWPTADGGLLTGAQDFTNADVIPAVVVGEPGGGYYRPPLPRRFPVEGYGYGLLPELEGEAVGIVVVAGTARAKLPGLRGTGAGTVGVAGISEAKIPVNASAIGQRGHAGAANAVFKELPVASRGVVGVHGIGAGVIEKLEAAAVGRCDDDAAVISFLLAA